MGGHLDQYAQGLQELQGLQGYQGNQSRPFQEQLAALVGAQARKAPVYSGSKPLVVCGGEVNEAKDLEDAQRMAEESAHAKGKNAYILKPVRMVAPKRDVVTTELA